MVEKALKNMSKHETSLFIVKPAYGFGKEGNSELNIPADTELQMEIELISFEKGKEDWGLSVEEKVEASRNRKIQGNNFVSKNITIFLTNLVPTRTF